MFDFFFRYFLLFPKISLTEEWGVLVGELALVAFVPYAAVRRRKLPRHPLVSSYALFLSFFILFSSLISAARLGVLPFHSTIYFVRTALYFGLLIWAFNSYSRYASVEEIVQKVYARPFLWQFVLGLIPVVIFYATYRPSLNEILWSYQLGLRMIPNAGLTIDTASPPFYLKPVGGSGNLLCSWSLAVLIIVNEFQGLKANKWLLTAVIVTVLLSLSRGGAVTLALYFLYTFAVRGKMRLSIKLLSFVVIAVLTLFFLFASNSITLPNILERFSITYEGGVFDASTQGRLVNYINLLSVWSSDFGFVLWGVGFDDTTLRLNTGEHIVESFFLQVLVCSGLIGVLVLGIYFLMAFHARVKNKWFAALWQFLLFESIVQWSVTGGDFYSQHVIFVSMTLIGFGLAENRARRKGQIDK